MGVSEPSPSPESTELAENEGGPKMKLRHVLVLQLSMVFLAIMLIGCPKEESDKKFVETRMSEAARQWKESPEADIAVLQEVVARGDRAIPYVVATLKSRDADERWLSIYVLGALNAKEGAPGVIALLEDDSFEVQTAAASQLGRWKSRSAVPGLIVLLRSGKAGPCSAAATALREIGGHSGVPALIESLGRHQNEGTQESIIGALNALALPSDLDSLRMKLLALESRRESDMESDLKTATEGLRSLIHSLGRS